MSAGRRHSQDESRNEQPHIHGLSSRISGPIDECDLNGGARSSECEFGFNEVSAWITKAADMVPADKYNYRPNDSVRSFAEQMLHLAAADAGMVMIGTGSKDPKIPGIFFSRNLEKLPSAQSKDSVVYFVTTSYDFVINTLKNLTDLRFDEVVTQQMPAAVRSEARLVWLQKAFEHQTHHRGQCTIYIRMQGIRPPGEKLF